MLAEVQMVGHRVELGWVEFGECWMRVLAVEAFLEAIDPVVVTR